MPTISVKKSFTTSGLLAKDFHSVLEQKGESFSSITSQIFLVAIVEAKLNDSHGISCTRPFDSLVPFTRQLEKFHRCTLLRTKM